MKDVLLIVLASIFISIATIYIIPSLANFLAMQPFQSIYQLTTFNILNKNIVKQKIVLLGEYIQ